MTRLTVGQEAIMALLATHRRVSLVRASGQGQKGGKINTGARAFNAALALESMGRIRRVGQPMTEHDTRRGYTVSYREMTFESV